MKAEGGVGFSGKLTIKVKRHWRNRWFGKLWRFIIREK